MKLNVNLTDEQVQLKGNKYLILNTETNDTVQYDFGFLGLKPLVFGSREQAEYFIIGTGNFDIYSVLHGDGLILDDGFAEFVQDSNTSSYNDIKPDTPDEGLMFVTTI